MIFKASPANGSVIFWCPSCNLSLEIAWKGIVQSRSEEDRSPRRGSSEGITRTFSDLPKDVEYAEILDNVVTSQRAEPSGQIRFIRVELGPPCPECGYLKTSIYYSRGTKYMKCYGCGTIFKYDKDNGEWTKAGY